MVLGCICVCFVYVCVWYVWSAPGPRPVQSGGLSAGVLPGVQGDEIRCCTAGEDRGEECRCAVEELW